MHPLPTNHEEFTRESIIHSWKLRELYFHRLKLNKFNCLWSFIIIHLAWMNRARQHAYLISQNIVGLTMKYWTSDTQCQQWLIESFILSIFTGYNHWPSWMNVQIGVQCCLILHPLIYRPEILKNCSTCKEGRLNLLNLLFERYVVILWIFIHLCSDTVFIWSSEFFLKI